MTTSDRQSHRGGPRGGTGASRPGSASSLLRALLIQEGAYRRRWRAEVRRTSHNDPHQSAVATVLAQHLWDIGEVPEADADLPRRLKDVVARAVGGGGISHQTLGWFVGAFEMTEGDERALWRQHEADLRATRPVSREVTTTTTTTTATSASSPFGAHPASGHTYRTQSLIEVFEVDEHRSRRRHSCVHVLCAQERMDRISYQLDTPDVTIELVRGGTPTGLRPGDEVGVHTLDVLLPAPLEPGESAMVEASATYPPGGPVVTDLRRRLRTTAGGVSLEVHFDPRAVPARVRWTERERSAPGEVHTVEVPLSASSIVHRFLTPDRDCIVGFEWDW